MTFTGPHTASAAAEDPPGTWMPVPCLWDDDLRRRWQAWRDQRILQAVAAKLGHDDHTGPQEPPTGAGWAWSPSAPFDGSAGVLRGQ